MKIIPFKFYLSAILFLAFNSLVIISIAQTTDHQPLKVSSETNVSNSPGIKLSLEKRTLMNVCPKCEACEKFCLVDAQKTKVSILAKNIMDENLTYIYTVSGGNIIGQGANVIWDFTGADLGDYTIEVEATNGKDLSFKSEKENITLIRCSFCGSARELPYCIAPNINVTTPLKSVMAGETIEFTATVSDGSRTAAGYKWYISNKQETITLGQQTSWLQSSEIISENESASIIKVKTTSAATGENLAVTVQVRGLCETGVTTASAGVYIDKPKD